MNINIHDVDECVLLDNIGKNTIKIQPTEISIGTFGSDYATEIEVRGILRDPDWRPNNFHFIPIAITANCTELYLEICQRSRMLYLTTRRQ